MPHIDTSAMLGWAMAPLFAAIVGYLLNEVVNRAKRASSHDEAVEQGVRCLLRSKLYEYHRCYVDESQPCPVSAKEDATNIYGAYHNLGGNGTGTRFYEEIMQAKGTTE